MVKPSVNYSHLIAEFDSDDEENLELLTEVQPLIASVQFNQLTMKSSSPLSINFLLMLIDRSPYLDSLILSLGNSVEFYDESVVLDRIEAITKLKLTEPIRPEGIEYLTNLFPKLQYLEVDCSSFAAVLKYVRLILIEQIDRLQDLRSLCFNVSAADDRMIQVLRRTVEKETKILPHTLRRIGSRLFLQWASTLT